MKITQCPICNSELEIDEDWVKKNERVFCGTCCKSFDFKLPISYANYAYTDDEFLVDEDDFIHYNNDGDSDEEDN